MYVAIGAGDTFVAIGMLMRKLAAAELAVGSDLAARLSGWLVSYSDHPDVRHLRSLIDRLSIVEARPGYAPVAPFRSLSVASRYTRRNEHVGGCRCANRTGGQFAARRKERLPLRHFRSSSPSAADCTPPIGGVSSSPSWHAKHPSCGSWPSIYSAGAASPPTSRTGRIAGWINSVVTDVMRCSLSAFTRPGFGNHR